MTLVITNRKKDLCKSNSAVHIHSLNPEIYIHLPHTVYMVKLLAPE